MKKSKHRIGKKVLALFMALMCIAAVGAVSASAKSTFHSKTPAFSSRRTPKYWDNGKTIYHYNKNGTYDIAKKGNYSGSVFSYDIVGHGNVNGYSPKYKYSYDYLTGKRSITPAGWKNERG